MKKLSVLCALALTAVAVFGIACSEKLPIEGIVSDTAIKMAVRSFMNDLEKPRSYARYDGVTYAACMAACNSVFTDKTGLSRMGAMDLIRHELETPDGLKKAYGRYKLTAFKEVRNRDVRGVVSDRIASILPYFDGTVPQEKVQILKEHHGSTFPYRYEDLLKKGLDITDLRAYEFAERRRAEGGNELVAAWAEILNDFAKTIGGITSPVF